MKALLPVLALLVLPRFASAEPAAPPAPAPAAVEDIPALTPAPPPADIAALVARLGADTFADRETAEDALATIGFPAFAALRTALASDNPEIHDRAQRLFDRLVFRTLFERWIARQPAVPQTHRWYAVSSTTDRVAVHHVQLTRQPAEALRYTVDAHTAWRDRRRSISRAVLGSDCTLVIMREILWWADKDGFEQHTLREAKVRPDGCAYRVLRQRPDDREKDATVLTPGGVVAEPLLPLIAVEMLDDSLTGPLPVRVVTGDPQDPQPGTFAPGGEGKTVDFGRGAEPVRIVAYDGPYFEHRRVEFRVARDGSRFEEVRMGDRKKGVKTQVLVYVPLPEAEAKAELAKDPYPTDGTLPGVGSRDK